LLFQNLNGDWEKNRMGLDDLSKIWSPAMTFAHALGEYRTKVDSYSMVNLAIINGSKWVEQTMTKEGK